MDYEGNEKLDHKELHIALLLLYDKLNGILPVHMTVPTREEVSNFIVRYDANNTGQLEFEEFLELAKALFGGERGWKDSILLRAGIMIVMNIIIWPLAGSGARRGLIGLGLGGAAAIPAPVMTILVENLAKTTKSTLLS